MFMFRDRFIFYACSPNGRKEKCIRIFVGKPEGKRPLGKPRHMWVDNNKMDLLEISWGRCRLDWSGSR
jgi:hypothetical protein